MKGKAIMATQKAMIGKKLNPRIRWGTEPDGRAARGNPCPDCGVAIGDLHHEYCDQEQCPRCFAQALSCNCKHG